MKASAAVTRPRIASGVSLMVVPTTAPFQVAESSIAAPAIAPRTKGSEVKVKSAIRSVQIHTEPRTIAGSANLATVCGSMQNQANRRDRSVHTSHQPQRRTHRELGQ